MIDAFERLLETVLAVFGRNFVILKPEETALIVGPTDDASSLNIRVREALLQTEDSQRSRTLVDVAACMWTREEMSDAAQLAYESYEAMLDALQQDAVNLTE